MRRFSNIDNEFMMNHDLSISEVYVLEWMLNLPIWADRIVVSKTTIFFASKNKACEDLPMVTKKKDTMYRYYKRLEEKELIKNHKISNKDYIEILPKCAEWNSVRSVDGNPVQVGFKSESIVDSNPTNSDITIDSDINNSEPPKDLFGEEIVDPKKKTLFKNCIYSDFSKFKIKMKEAEALGIDIGYYHRAMDRWSRTSTTKRTADGWIATAETWMEKDKDKGKLKMMKSGNQVVQEDQEALEYLNIQ